MKTVNYFSQASFLPVSLICGLALRVVSPRGGGGGGGPCSIHDGEVRHIFLVENLHPCYCFGSLNRSVMYFLGL